MATGGKSYMTFSFGSRSRTNLKGVHPDLVRVMERAIEISGRDFAVIEGLRTPERQAQLVADGFSTTERSRHLTGHAVDVVPYHDGRPTYTHWPAFYDLADYVKQAARELNIPVEWGGDWQSFPDGAHWQLPRDSHRVEDYNAPAGIGLLNAETVTPPSISAPSVVAEEEDRDRTGLVAGAATVAGGGVTAMSVVEQVTAQPEAPAESSPATITSPSASPSSSTVQPDTEGASASLMEQALALISDTDRLILIFGVLALVSGLFLLYRRVTRWNRTRPAKQRR